MIKKYRLEFSFNDIGNIWLALEEMNSALTEDIEQQLYAQGYFDDYKKNSILSRLRINS